jgi:hypothetical protein
LVSWSEKRSWSVTASGAFWNESIGDWTQNKVMDLAPFELVVLAFCISSLGGVGVMLLGDKPLTVRRCLGTVIFHGCFGSGLGLVGYDYFGWKARPSALVGFAALYGVGAVTAEHIKTIITRIVGGSRSGGPDGANN